MYKIGDLELSPENGFIINDPLEFPSTGKFEENSIWRGQKVYVSNISRSAVKGKISGKCDSRLSMSNLLYYDVNNYDWNYDEEDVYLIEDNTRMWKLKMVSLSTKPLISEYYEFEITVIVDDPSSSGTNLRTSEGTIDSSPTNISGLINIGDKNSDFESIQIDGVYFNTKNVKNPVLQHNLSRYIFNLSDEILDGARIYFYPKTSKSNHIYEDSLSSSSLFDHNKNSSSGVSYSESKLNFSASGYLIFKFSLLHPLQFDPVLTLSIINLSGNPKISVSREGTYYWDIDKPIQNGSLIEYILTKLSGNNEFYIKIYCGESDSFQLTYMKLNSWHSISGQQPYIQVLANSENDVIICNLDSGQINYTFSWRDKYNY